MSDPRAYTGNAGDAKQNKFAERMEKRDARRRVESVRQQMATAAGREFMWRMLGSLGIFNIIDGPMERVYAENAVANEGRKLLVELMRDHAAAYLVMYEEALKRHAQDAREVEAAHTLRVEDATT